MYNLTTTSNIKYDLVSSVALKTFCSDLHVLGILECAEGNVCLSAVYTCAIRADIFEADAAFALEV